MNKNLLYLLFLLSGFSLHAQWTSLNTGVAGELRSVEAVNADTIYAAGVNVLIKSVDGGANWNQIPIVNLLNQPINSLTINDLHFIDVQTGIAVGVQANYTRVILRTADGGAHWSIVVFDTDINGNTGGLYKTYFFNNSTGWAVGSSGTVYKTTDGGLSWVSSNIPEVTQLYDVQFVNDQLGLVCGEVAYPGNVSLRKLVQSTNGGLSWDQWYVDYGALPRSLSYLTEKIAYIADNQGFITRLNDGLNVGNYTNVSMPDLAPAHRLYFSDTTTGYALTDFSIRRTTDGGLFWEQANLTLTAGQELTDFDFLPDGLNGFAVGKAGKAFRTTNGGAPFTPMSSFTPEPYMFTDVCANQLVHLNNPAPEADFSSQWFLNGQLFSESNDADVSFPEPNTTYSIQLKVTNANGSSDYTREFRTAPKLDFSLGELQWGSFPPVCAGAYLDIQLVNPTPGITYTFYLNDVPFGQQTASSTGTLSLYTPPMTENSIIKVEGMGYDACGSLVKSDTLHAQVFAFPRTDLPVETTTPNVCVYDSAFIVIHQSEIGVWYQFQGGINAGAVLPGNGGDLSFYSPALQSSNQYTILAHREICPRVLDNSLYIQVDPFTNLLDTLSNYGMVGAPIKVNNPSVGLEATFWNFGSACTPETSSEFKPTVVFSQSGSFPYSYEYHSLACTGTVSGNFDIYSPGPNLEGAECGVYTLSNLKWQAEGSNPIILASAVDNTGTLVTTGSARDFDNPPAMNLFLQKNNADGQLLWHKRVYSYGVDHNIIYSSTFGTGLAVAPDNQLFLCGTITALQTEVFGWLIDQTYPFNKYTPQGFLMKLSPDGEVVWHIYLQSSIPDAVCAPSSLVYSAYDNRIYMVVVGPSWQAELADGNIISDYDPDVAAWLLSFNTDGQFQESRPIGRFPFSALLGRFNPSPAVINYAISTFTSPRLREGPDGLLYLGAMVHQLDTLTFGSQTAIAADMGLRERQRNHFIAIFDRKTSDWSHAFFSHSLLDYSGYLEVNGPAWRVDSAGNTWVGIGWEPPETPPLAFYPALFRIGDGPVESAPGRGYLAQFRPDGHLNWLSRSNKLFFHELLDNHQGGMYALAGFIRAAGFQLPSGAYQGTAGLGEKDALLAEISGAGALEGLQLIGTSANDQPLALAQHPASGALYTVYVPNLNEYMQSAIPQSYELEIFAPDGICPILPSLEPEVTAFPLEVYPNPISGGQAMTLRFSLPEAGNTTIIISDMLGRLQWQSDLGWLNAGMQSLPVAPAGHELDQGVYQVSLVHPEGKGVTRVVVVK